MITAVIQARVSSTRLPKKVLLKLNGRTVLENVIERLKRSRLIGQLIVATSLESADDAIAKLCQAKKIKCFRGSLNNVLDRFYQTALAYRLTDICRITADCPLLDPRLIDQVAKKYLSSKVDYLSTAYPIPTWPDGLDVEIFSFKALKKAWRQAKLPSEQEHVTPYIWKNPKKFKLLNLKNKTDLSAWRWTLDEPRDLKFIRAIYRRLGKNKKMFYLEDVLKLLKEQPRLVAINGQIKRNEGYLKSLQTDKQFNSRSYEKK